MRRYAGSTGRTAQGELILYFLRTSEGLGLERVYGWLCWSQTQDFGLGATATPHLNLKDMD